MMGQATAHTAAVVGVTAVPVDVEVDVGAGLPSFAIVGLPDTAVQEARERVRSALRASGFNVPNARIVVNLAPGPVRKHGTGFDLPIALGILAATRQVSAQMVDGFRAVGELSLDGRVRSVPGMLAHCVGAHTAGMPLMGPWDSRSHEALGDLEYLGVRALSQVRDPQPRSATALHPASNMATVDFSQVAGQDGAVRALVAAAAGGHNVLLVGPPGSGKTMLARRLPTILPSLCDDERLETALVHSVAGLDETPVLGGVRPFRAPHHSASVAGLVGGGTPPRPGEASLAHNGVLFLDEMPEFGPAALQALRQPLEDGTITLVRAEGRLTFPAAFNLVGAANPCPCGHLGDPRVACTCAPTVVSRYLGRIGGPLMDRIDMVVDVPRPDPGLIIDPHASVSSATLASTVEEARERSQRRSGEPVSAMTGAPLLAACALDTPSTRFLEAAAHTQHLSGRGITRLLRVARTLADLDARERVSVDHLAEALSYRHRPAPAHV